MATNEFNSMDLYCRFETIEELSLDLINAPSQKQVCVLASSIRDIATRGKTISEELEQAESEQRAEQAEAVATEPASNIDQSAEALPASWRKSAILRASWEIDALTRAALNNTDDDDASRELATKGMLRRIKKLSHAVMWAADDAGQTEAELNALLSGE